MYSPSSTIKLPSEAKTLNRGYLEELLAVSSTKLAGQGIEILGCGQRVLVNLPRHEVFIVSLRIDIECAMEF